MNDSLDLALEALGNIEAPLSTQEGIGLALIAFGTGLGIGLLIT